MGRLLRPGGLLVVAEFPEQESHLTLLPPSIEQFAPGLPQRLADASRAWFASMRSGLAGSTPSRPLTEMVVAAGLEVVGSRVDRIRLDAPMSAAARRVAVGHLEMIRKQMTDFLPERDLGVLDDLCDPDNDRGLFRHAGLFVEAARLVVAARKPDEEVGPGSARKTAMPQVPSRRTLG